MDRSQVELLESPFHEKSRFTIVTVLLRHGILSFSELKSLLNMTDGNLSVHLRSLDRLGYLSVCKCRAAGRARTTCRLSEKGRLALNKYLENMEKLVKSVRRLSKRRPQDLN